jgi:very-short-patch-repair endonuclease
VVELAQRQHGVVARRQLLEAGVSSASVGRMLASGWLRRVHAGVYATAGRPRTAHPRWMAAALAGGPEALLSHTSAGGLWGMIDPVPGPVHVTASGGGHRRIGIVFHRADDLGEIRRVRDRIPVTTPTRTVLDLAAVLSTRRLGRAIERADRHGLLEVAELVQLCEASTGLKGTGRLSSLLAQHRPFPDTRSELERRFLRLCRDAGLPRPAVNVPVKGLEVDCVWLPQRLVVELDGYAFHGDRRSFERDRQRDAALQLGGYRVVRVTHRRLAHEPEAVVAEVRVLLGLRPSVTAQF